jgi:hypothetical protein
MAGWNLHDISVSALAWLKFLELIVLLLVGFVKFCLTEFYELKARRKKLVELDVGGGPPDYPCYNRQPHSRGQGPCQPGAGVSWTNR